MELFSIICLTCRRRLKVLDAAGIGQIVACPNCGSMVPIVAPAGWQSPASSAAPIEADSGKAAESATTSAAQADMGASGDQAEPLPAAETTVPALPSAIVDAPDGGLDLAAPLTAPQPAVEESILNLPRARVVAFGGALAAAASLFIAGGWWMWRPTAAERHDEVSSAEASLATSDLPPHDGEPLAVHDAAAADADNAIDEDEDIEQAVKPPPALPAANPAPADDIPEDVSREDEPAKVAVAAVRQPGQSKAGSADAKEKKKEADKAKEIAKASEEMDETSSAVGDEGQTVPRGAFFVFKPVDAEARLQDPLPRVRCQELALRKFMDVLTQFSGVAITLDVESLADAGVPLDTTVTLDVRDGTMAELLAAALEPLGLSYQIVGDQLAVGHGRSGGEEPLTRRYDVRALTHQGYSANRLAAVVQRVVLPGSWQSDGGLGEIEVEDGELGITHSPRAHRRVADLLSQWKSVRTGSADSRPANAVLQTQANLAQPRTVTFYRPTPLVQVLRRLETLCDVRFLVDWRSLRAAGIPPTVEATLAAEDKPLAEILREMLQPWGAGYRLVGPGMLEIASQADLQTRREVEFHAAADLASTAEAGSNLVARLRAELSLPAGPPAAAGVLAFDAPSRTILASQPGSLQLTIDELLQSWRTSGGNR
ncbi:MAG: hypothetical protein AB7O62_04625 [Pirellulales bacterium]